MPRNLFAFLNCGFLSCVPSLWVPLAWWEAVPRLKDSTDKGMFYQEPKNIESVSCRISNLATRSIWCKAHAISGLPIIKLLFSMFNSWGLSGSFWRCLSPTLQARSNVNQDLEYSFTVSPFCGLSPTDPTHCLRLSEHHQSFPPFME